MWQESEVQHPATTNLFEGKRNSVGSSKSVGGDWKAGSSDVED